MLAFLSENPSSDQTLSKFIHFNQKNKKGSCLDCPINTYKTMDGLGKCTSCPKGFIKTLNFLGRITGNLTGYVLAIDCYCKNKSLIK